VFFSRYEDVKRNDGMESIRVRRGTAKNSGQRIRTARDCRGPQDDGDEGDDDDGED